MEQQEKEFIYRKLHYLTEQINHMQSNIEGILVVTDKLVKHVEDVVSVVNVMNTEEYAFAQAKKAEALEIASKLQMMRDIITQAKKKE